MKRVYIITKIPKDFDYISNVNDIKTMDGFIYFTCSNGDVHSFNKDDIIRLKIVEDNN